MGGRWGHLHGDPRKIAKQKTPFENPVNLSEAASSSRNIGNRLKTGGGFQPSVTACLEFLDNWLLSVRSNPSVPVARASLPLGARSSCSGAVHRLGGCPTCGRLSLRETVGPYAELCVRGGGGLVLKGATTRPSPVHAFRHPLQVPACSVNVLGREWLLVHVLLVVVVLGLLQVLDILLGLPLLWRRIGNAASFLTSRALMPLSRTRGRRLRRLRLRGVRWPPGPSRSNQMFGPPSITTPSMRRRRVRGRGVILPKLRRVGVLEVIVEVCTYVAYDRLRRGCISTTCPRIVRLWSWLPGSTWSAKMPRLLPSEAVGAGPPSTARATKKRHNTAEKRTAFSAKKKSHSTSPKRYAACDLPLLVVRLLHGVPARAARKGLAVKLIWWRSANPCMAAICLLIAGGKYLSNVCGICSVWSFQTFCESLHPNHATPLTWMNFGLHSALDGKCVSVVGVLALDAVLTLPIAFGGLPFTLDARQIPEFLNSSKHQRMGTRIEFEAPRSILRGCGMYAKAMARQWCAWAGLH